MTNTPLLPVSLTRPAPPAAPEPEATKAELDCLLQLALRRNGCSVAIGRGRSPAAARAGPSAGWSQMTRWLLWSTPWQPERTVAFASIATGRAIGLVGAVNLDGLAGATADGGTWAVREGQLRTARRNTEAR